MLAMLLGACDSAPPPQQPREALPNVYLEALQEAEALRHTVEERNLEQRRIDELLGRVPAADK